MFAVLFGELLEEPAKPSARREEAAPYSSVPEADAIAGSGFQAEAHPPPHCGYDSAPIVTDAL